MGKPEHGALPSLTGLRAPAAFMVFAYHMQWMAPGLHASGHHGIADFLDRVALKGYVGVSFFFVLSGFVLAFSQRPSQDRARFWWRRAVRVYPNHIVTWLLAGLLIVAGITAAPPVGAALANLVLLPHVMVPGAEWTVMNDPSWSIEVEAFFYLLFPFLFIRASRLADDRLRRLIVTVGTIVIGVPALVVVAGAGENEGIRRLLYFFPLCRLPEFVVGMGLGLLAKRKQLPRVGVGPAWVMVVIGCAISTVAPIPMTFAAVTLVPFSLLIVAYATRDLSGRPSRASGGFWTHLGRTSYAFYVSHLIVIRLIEWGVGAGPIQPGDAAAITVLALAGGITAAELLYRGVERPAIRRLRDRGPRGMPVGLDLGDPSD